MRKKKKVETERIKERKEKTKKKRIIERSQQLRGLISESISLESKQVREYQQGRCRIIQQKKFVLSKEKVYLLSRKGKGEAHEFIDEQSRKENIKLSKLPQISPVFFVKKKNSKKQMV